MEVETVKTKEDIEAEISRAIQAWVKDFKKQADSLTLKGVRRALEKELGMEIFSLDVHKGFVKHCLEESFYGGDDVGLTTTVVSTSDRDLPWVNKETSGEKDEQDSKGSRSDLNENAEESAAGDVANCESIKTQVCEHATQPGVDTIKNAILKRASYFKENLDKITLGKVRRLLEEDLNLRKNTLDAYKSFISDVLDEVLQTPETAENTNGSKEEPIETSQNKEISRKRKEAKVAAAEGSESSNLDEKSEDNEDVKEKMPKKRARQKSKSIAKDTKQRKRSLGENKKSGSRKKKFEKLDLGKNSESEDEESAEDDQLLSSSDERSKKKQEKPTTQAYGKHVEHLKSIIKACGMSVPPSVYKRAKQASEGKREAVLIKELEEILAKEDLSTNPSDKEIIAVRKRKERARELEGIDMSNIVSTSRRRSTSNYIPIPKPKIEVSDEDEEDEEEQEDEDEDNEDNEEYAEDGDNGGGDSI